MLIQSIFTTIHALFIEERRNKKKEDIDKTKNAKIFILICLAIFVFNGSALSVYSLFTSNRAEYGGFNFIFLYLFFCAVLCGLVLFVLWAINKKKGSDLAIKNCVEKRPLICTLIYGALFFGSEFLSIMTTTILPIVIQAPLTFAMNVVIVAIVDYLIYKQKLTKIQIIQIALAIISGVCFAL